MIEIPFVSRHHLDMERLVHSLGRLDIVEAHVPAGVPFPAELWLDILSDLASPDLSTMRRVSQELRQLVNPFLFKSCVLRIQTAGPVGLRPKIAFYTSPAIAASVRDCTVLGCRHNTPAAITDICAALPQLRNLRHLTFQYVRMSPTMITTIRRAALPTSDSLSLASLSLVSCVTDFPDSSTHGAGAVTLKSVLIHNELHPTFPHDDRWFSLLNLDLLQSLDVAQPHMTRAFVEWLARPLNIQLPVLESLQLHVSGLDDVMDKFLSVLTLFSSLRVLGVKAGPPYNIVSYWRGYPRISCVPHGLPLLTSFHGPATQAAVYCAGRTLVRHLKLYGAHLNQAISHTTLLVVIKDIARAAPHLQSLELRSAHSLDRVTVALAESFPALRSLRVVIPHFSEGTIATLLNTLEILALPRAIEVLFVIYRVTDRAPWPAVPTSDADMVSAILTLTQHAPTLQKVCICCDLPRTVEDAGYPQHTPQPESIVVWLWNSYASGTVSQQTVAGKCVDGRKNNVGIRSEDFEKYTAADALDDEWLVATAAHRIA
ncbi:hypothetical protein DFH06DRAFT_1370730 [Mycena polygramma]|nr:hypothetical protein DFH06DRAFT_1370730 [Mycena polygramma]